jgi:hypothetical protein
VYKPGKESPCKKTDQSVLVEKSRREHLTSQHRQGQIFLCYPVQQKTFKTAECIWYYSLLSEPTYFWLLFNNAQKNSGTIYLIHIYCGGKAI